MEKISKIERSEEITKNMVKKEEPLSGAMWFPLSKALTSFYEFYMAHDLVHFDELAKRMPLTAFDSMPTKLRNHGHPEDADKWASGRLEDIQSHIRSVSLNIDENAVVVNIGPEAYKHLIGLPDPVPAVSIDAFAGVAVVEATDAMKRLFDTGHDDLRKKWHHALLEGDEIYRYIHETPKKKSGPHCPRCGSSGGQITGMMNRGLN